MFKKKLKIVARNTDLVFNRVESVFDRNENPHMLEINANPCISPDSGYMAAAREAGYEPENIIDKLLADIN